MIGKFLRPVFRMSPVLFFGVLFSLKSHAQTVSISFTNGYIGTQGSNTNKANSIKKFSTLGISRASFSQVSPNGQFGGTQGNDLTGTIKLYLNSGTVITLTGALNWRETTGSTVEVFGFIFDPGQNASITYGGGSTYNIVGGSTPNTSSTIGMKAYASTFTFTDGENRAGNAATSGLLDALNAELANTPQPSAVTLSSSNVVEGNNLQYNVTLSATTTSTQVCTFTISGTAATPLDYNATLTFSNGVINNGDGTITIPAGVSSFTITVTTIDNATVQSTRTLTLNIGSKTATGNILDNDSGAVLSVNGTLNAFSACTGTATSPQSFDVSGTGLTANLVATAPAGYELSTTSGGTYGTSVSLTPVAGTVANTTLYVRLKSNAVNGASGNIVISSTGATNQNLAIPAATVSPLSVGGTSSGTATVCSGTNSTLLSLTGNTGNIQWQSSADNTSFTNISSATASSYTATNLTATTYFRAVVTSGSCSAANSTVSLITVNQPTVTGTISGGGISVCSGTNSTTLSLSGNTGSVVKWQSAATADFSGTVTDISNTNTTYTATNLTATTYYRVIVQNGVCSPASSGAVVLNVLNNCNTDSDGDGVPDSQEAIDGTDPNNPCSFKTASQTLTPSAAWNAADCDGDGVSNSKEKTDGTDPNDPCSFKTASQTLTPSAAWNAADCDGDGVSNGQEKTDGTDPNDACSFKTASQTLTPSAAWNATDCDGDGVSNGKEKTDGTDPNDPCSFKTASQTLTPSAAWNAADCDGDGVSNGKEKADGTDPNDPCSFKTASQSLTPSAAWNAADCDGDGVSNGQEKTDGTDPNDPCSFKTASQTLTPSAAWNAADCDGDGVSNGQEKTDGTDPNDPCSFKTASQTLTPSAAWNTADCDGDGVSNGKEKTDGTDPNDPCSFKTASQTLTPSAAWNAADCDGDGVSNGKEKTDGTDPNDPCSFKTASQTLTPSAAWNAADCDGDGVSNGQEKTDGTDPNDPCSFKTASQTLTPSAAWNAADCDGDGVSNGKEKTDGTDPKDPCSFKTASQTLTPTAAWNAADCDGDGVSNGKEKADGTDPNDPCSSKIASQTLTPSAAWNAADCDGDGVSNGKEKADGTDPNDPCSSKIASQTLTPSAAWNAADCDGDGVSNGKEKADGTDPNDPCSSKIASQTLTPSAAWNAADCDGDGVSNGKEKADGTDPNDPCSSKIASQTLTPSAAWNAADCDGDGVSNGKEKADGTDPNDPCSSKIASQTLTPSAAWNAADCDGDGVSNGKEKADGTDPNDKCAYKVTSQTMATSAAWNNADCDGDGVTNAKELADGTDPTNSCSLKTESQSTTPSAAWMNADCNNDGTPNGEVLIVTKAASAPVLQSDGSMTIKFVITLTNPRPDTLKNIMVQDDLTKVFASPMTFTCTGTSVSGALVKSAGYDGSFAKDLLTSASYIKGYSKDSIVILVRFNANGFAGGLKNIADVSANGKWGPVTRKSVDVSQANQGVNGSVVAGSATGVVTPFTVPQLALVIPGGFSPNRDGIDDRLIITRPYGTRINLQVYNRWGNIVYQNENYNNDWDGRGTGNFMGQDLPSGTYFYVVQAFYSSGQLTKQAGSLTLVR